VQFPCFPPYLLLEVLIWPAVLVIFLVPSFVFPYHCNKFQQDHGIEVDTLEVNYRRGFIERCERARNVKARYQIFNLLAYTSTTTAKVMLAASKKEVLQ